MNAPERRSQSPDADALIARYESSGKLILTAYQDSGGVWTIGRGHTRGVTPGMKITKAQEQAFYETDVRDAIDTIYANIPAEIVDAWPQQCFDALVSFVFNLGPKAFRDPETGARTDFWRACMNPDLTAVPKQMQRWVKGNGRVLPGLVARRGAEAALWGKGIDLAQANDRYSGAPSLLSMEHAEIEQQTRAEPDIPAPPRMIEHPAVPAAAAAGGVGIATVATTLTSAGTSMTAQGNTIAIVLGVMFIMVGVIVMLIVAKRS
jgi:GH24 family phage-related lysozyme (muramidase)